MTKTTQRSVRSHSLGREGAQDPHPMNFLMVKQKQQVRTIGVYK